jgi:hypothetical protein
MKADVTFRMPVIRAYYNIASDYPKVYSVDFGDSSSEENLVDLRFERGGQFKFDKEALPDTPKCWIEFKRAVLELYYVSNGKIGVIK